MSLALPRQRLYNLTNLLKVPPTFRCFHNPLVSIDEKIDIVTVSNRFPSIVGINLRFQKVKDGDGIEDLVRLNLDECAIALQVKRSVVAA